MIDEFQFEFNNVVDVHDFGRMKYTVVYATERIIDQLSLVKNPRLRINGVIAGQSFNGAFQPAKEKRYYLILSKKFCKSANVKIGDEILVAFDIADQDEVNIPRPLQLALGANSRAARVWNSISPGKKRGLAHRVSSAKRTVTIENRVQEVIDTLVAWDAKRK